MTESNPKAFKRGSGVLAHISSLPADFGIGDLGPGAYQFADFLASAKQLYWQVLPLNPTDMIYGNSPYSSNSAFAINTVFISPEELLNDGLLAKKDLASATKFSKDIADYAAAGAYKQKILEVAFANFKKNPALAKEFAQFCKQHDLWLDDYALFLVLKEKFAGQVWYQWPDQYRKREPQALAQVTEEYASKLERIKFGQFLAFRQWMELKKYCQSKKVKLIGDIPIYVNDDSADVWGNPEIFKLNDSYQPIFVSGVPPDYFSETGQRWGTPVYNWEALKADDYGWWLKRVEHNLELFDIIRIDHFRGLVGYWEIPAEEPTAIKGEWVPGPGDSFFQKLQEEFSDLPIIAEDLGIITPDVTETMERFGLPGMKVLLFAFGGDLSTHPYIPENYHGHCVVYTGTHDNNTVKGWLENDASEQELANLHNYVGKKIKAALVPWEFVRMAMMSKADLAITPLQDLLALGQEARMNRPGTTQGNWQWRFSSAALTPKVASHLRLLTVQAKRA